MTIRFRLLHLQVPVPVLMAVSACAAVPPASMRPRAEPGAELVREGDRLRRMGRETEAAGTYREAIAVDPGQVRAHAGLQAIGLLEGRHLELRRAYRGGGNPYLTGRLEPTGRARLEAFRAAVEPWRSIGLGSAAVARGARRRGRMHYRRAIALDPGNAWAHIGMGRVQLSLGRLGDAEDHFRAALWSEPEHPTPALGLSVIADRRGDLGGAFSWALEAYRRAPRETVLSRRVYSLAVRSGRRSRLRAAADALDRSGALGEGGALLDAGRLHRRLGEGEEAERAFAAARKAGATAAELEAVRSVPVSRRVRPFVNAFVRGVQARYRHYAMTGEAERFRDFFAWSRALFERTVGVRLGPPARPVAFSFVGKFVDPRKKSDAALVRACAQEGLLLVLGQRSGGPPEALLADIVRREGMRKVTVRGMEVEREAVWIGRRHLSGYEEWSGGGDVAGLALARIVIIDLHAVARWEGDIRRTLARLERRREAVLSERALCGDPVTSIEDPAGVAERLFLQEELAMAEEVLVHENAHLVDAELHLPVAKHPLRNLGLALRRGFRPSEILAFLERNAQLSAICAGPTPRVSLAICCASLDRRGAHARGYREIVQGFVDRIHAQPGRYPRIDPGRLIVQQLHLLSADDVRAIARHLMRRWDVQRPR